MKTMIHNLINGNIKAAKKAAKRYKGSKIFHCAFNALGFPEREAMAIARYSKGEIKWEEYCAAKA